jgi:NADH-quinone oxidoreductase subunit M
MAVDAMSGHPLSYVLFTPLAGALVLLLIPSSRPAWIKLWANFAAVAGLAVSVPLWRRFDKSLDGFQFVERAEWIPSLGIRYSLGVDGISLLLVLLTALMGAVAVLSSWDAVHDRLKQYYALLLVLQTGMIGVFVSLDLILFYIFWEVVLVPMYFLIGVWGGPRKLYAAIKFFLYTLAASVLMLVGILALYFQHFSQFGVLTFDYADLLRVQMPFWLEQAVFWSFFLGFAVKVPMFPFHTWLPDAHTEAPTAGSVILAAVLLKMGTYGFLRFSLPLLPRASATLYIVEALVALSIIAILYGALVCLAQKDWKRLVAYSSVSHLGFCTLGIFSLNANGIGGSVIQQINHGISTGMLFLIVGVVYERRHTREIADFGGLAHSMPRFAAVFAIAMLSSAGLPLLNGFVGEFTILAGAFEARPAWAAMAAPGIVLGAAYLLWLYQRTILGTVTHEANRNLADLNLRELAVFAPLLALAIGIGIYSKPVFEVLDRPVNRLVQHVNPARAAPPALALRKGGVR